MIQGNNISKDYFIDNQKRLQVFNNINFNIERNEKVGFLGLNGSGKSTICKIISQSEPISSGELKISSSISWPIGIYNCLKELLAKPLHKKWIKLIKNEIDLSNSWYNFKLISYKYNLPYPIIKYVSMFWGGFN